MSTSLTTVSVEMVEMWERLEKAAQALLNDVHRRYPGEELRCQYMRELEAACKELE
jgi:hypothetical protein